MSLGAQNKWKEQLQWGRNFIVAEMSTVKHYCGDLIKLQWGRNFIVAEIRQGVIVRRQIDIASMGPQLYRCGNKAKRDARRYPQIQLQWGRNFIVAEIRRTRWRCSRRSCFNGAATLSLRKCSNLSSASQPILSFNGAATLSLRKWPSG